MGSYTQSHSLREFLKEEWFPLIVIFICYLLAGITSIWSLTIGLLFVVLYCMNARRVPVYRYFSGTFVFLLVSCIFVFFVSINNGFSFVYGTRFPIAMLCSYLLGRFYIDRYRSEEVLFFILLLMALSLGILHMIATVNDIIIIGLVNPERTLGTLDDFQRATTQRTTELSLCIACFSMLFIPRREIKNPFVKNAYILVAIIASLCVLHYVSRTGVALVVVTLIVGLVYRWGISWKTLLLFIIIIVCYGYLKNSELFQVFASRETDVSNLKNVGLRTERWSWGINYLFSNPWGNISIGEYKLEYYAHNFWIDYGIGYGLIAALFMACFSLRSFFSSLKFARKKSASKNLSLVVLTFSIVIALSLFTEPIIYGAPSYLIMYLMFCGIVEKIDTNNNVYKHI